MIEGKLVDLVPFEDDYATYLESWMNEEAWFRAHLWERREPHTEDMVKKFIEKMEKNERGALIGFQAKNGDPIGCVIFDHEWSRVRKADVTVVVGDTRYEGTDEALDGLLMLLRYCFETRSLHRVDAVALTFDEVKFDMYERAGFAHEGTLRQHIRYDGDYVDIEMFGLLEDEWPGYETITEKLGLQPSGLEPKPKLEKKDDKDGAKDNDKK
ncbi:MAG: GNAT family N-acetyltransferase [Anaerolineae bacterium]|nr:GNAT family N-acetyltransferase [Anaerolineae bacterium]